jgi:hypothetical protein
LGIEADASFGDQSDQQPVFGFGAFKLTNHGQHTFRARRCLAVLSFWPRQTVQNRVICMYPQRFLR